MISSVFKQGYMSNHFEALTNAVFNCSQNLENLSMGIAFKIISFHT